MSNPISLNRTTAEALLKDLTDVADDVNYAGTFIETQYGVLYVPDEDAWGATLAVEHDIARSQGWNYVWLRLDELEDYRPGFSQAEVLRAATASTARVRVTSRQAYVHRVVWHDHS